MDRHLHRARDDRDARQLVVPLKTEGALAAQMTRHLGSPAPFKKMYDADGDGELDLGGK